MIEAPCVHGRPLRGCLDCDTPTGGPVVWVVAAMVVGVLLLVLAVVWTVQSP
jgi:hypothetical protein